MGQITDLIEKQRSPVTDYADDIRAAAEILGGRDFVLISHSNGSLASLYFATRMLGRPAEVAGEIRGFLDEMGL